MKTTHEQAPPGIGGSIELMVHIKQIFHSHCQTGKRIVLGPREAQTYTSGDLFFAEAMSLQGPCEAGNAPASSHKQKVAAACQYHNCKLGIITTATNWLSRTLGRKSSSTWRRVADHMKWEDTGASGVLYTHTLKDIFETKMPYFDAHACLCAGP